MFPKALRKHMTGLTIPTLGEICGWGDNWDKEHIEPDSDEQLPLMKQRRSRVAYYNNECSSGWLRNAMKKEFSSAGFAYVNHMAIRASAALRTLVEFVRNSGWLDKSRALCPVLYFMEDKLKCRNRI